MEYTIRPRSVSLDDSYDVIVAGGGPAGVAAAYSAAREGAKVLSFRGDRGSRRNEHDGSGGPCWRPYSDGERMVYGGIAERILMAG